MGQLRVFVTCILLLSTTAAGGRRSLVEKFDSALRTTRASLPELWRPEDGPEWLLDIWGVRVSFGPALEDRQLVRPTKLERFPDSWEEEELDGEVTFRTVLSLGSLKSRSELFIYQFGPDHQLRLNLGALLSNATLRITGRTSSDQGSVPCHVGTEYASFRGDLALNGFIPSLATAMKVLMYIANWLPNYNLYPFFHDYPSLIMDNLFSHLVTEFCGNQTSSV